MATREGTLLIAPVRIQDTSIPYPVAFSNEIQGGLHTVSTLAERNTIPVHVRQWGMQVTVFNDGSNNKTFELKRGLANIDLSDNANWAEKVSGAIDENSKIYKVLTITTDSFYEMSEREVIFGMLIDSATPFNINIGKTVDGSEYAEDVDLDSINFLVYSRSGGKKIYFSNVTVEITIILLYQIITL